MNIIEKRDIQYRLRDYVSSFSSQKKAAESIADCSEATVIAMLSEREMWDSISENMWRNVASQVSDREEDFSKLVETQNWHTLMLYFQLAKDEGATFAFTGNAGWGKSYTAKYFAAINRRNNVYYLECAEWWSRKLFIQKLLMQMGKSSNGLGFTEMFQTAIRELRRQQKPLIVIDEIDKLPDPVFKLFITFYNELNKKCGFVWTSTDAIEKRIETGIHRNAVGFNELFSRIGANFIKLNQPYDDEVKEICVARGVTEVKEVSLMINEVKNVKGDLRRLDRMFLKEKLKKIRKPQKTA